MNNSDAEKDVTCAMVCRLAAGFYDSLPSGRTTAGKKAGGARQDQINNPLVDLLGEPPGHLSYWIGGKSDFEDWRNAPETQTKPKFVKALKAIYETWTVDLTADQRFIGEITVRPGAEDMITMGRVTIEPTPPGAERPYLLRSSSAMIEQKTKSWTDRKGRDVVADLGFLDAHLVVEMPCETGSADFQALTYDGSDTSFKPILKELNTSAPSAQEGMVIGLNVLWGFHDSHWRLIKPTDKPLHNGGLTNASLLEFFAEPGDVVQVSLTVAEEDFWPVVHLTGSGSGEDDAYKKRVRSQLASQVLKQRLVGKDRFTLAGGKVPVK